MARHGIQRAYDKMQYHNYIVHCGIDYDILHHLRASGCNSKIYFVFQQKKGLHVRVKSV